MVKHDIVNILKFLFIHPFPYIFQIWDFHMGSSTLTFALATRWRRLFSQIRSNGSPFTQEPSLSFQKSQHVLVCLPPHPVMGCFFPSASFPLYCLTHLCYTSNHLLKYAPCRLWPGRDMVEACIPPSKVPTRDNTFKKSHFENSGKFYMKSPNMKSLKGQERQVLNSSLHSKLVTLFPAPNRLR